MTQEDYEAVIRQIPGLGIHKVRAFAPEGGSGGIRVAVKPLSEEPYPHLPAVYRPGHTGRDRKRRMLAAGGDPAGPDLCAKLDVSGTVLIKPFYDNAETQVEGALIALLDCVSTERPFGSVLSFHEICRATEALDCVAEVSRLVLRPRIQDNVQIRGRGYPDAGEHFCVIRADWSWNMEGNDKKSVRKRGKESGSMGRDENLCKSEGQTVQKCDGGHAYGEGGVLLTDGGRSGMSVSRLFLPALVAEQPGKEMGQDPSGI